jgi:hypothetical protein
MFTTLSKIFGESWTTPSDSSASIHAHAMTTIPTACERLTLSSCSN